MCNVIGILTQFVFGWSKFCVKKCFNCDVEISWYRRNILYMRVCMCVVKYFNCAVEMLW